MDSDPRLIREKGDQDAINEAARAWVNGEHKKAREIVSVLEQDRVPDARTRFYAAVNRMSSHV